MTKLINESDTLKLLNYSYALRIKAIPSLSLGYESYSQLAQVMSHTLD